MRKSEEKFEEVRSLSPIEEESESTLCFKKASINFSEPEGSDYRMTRFPYKDYQRILRKSEGNRNVYCELRERMRFDGNSMYELDTLKYKKSDSAGDSSSEDERMEQDYYQLRRVAGSYCCFGPDAFKGFFAF